MNYTFYKLQKIKRVPKDPYPTDTDGSLPQNILIRRRRRFGGEFFEGFLMGPSFDSKIGLGVEADAEDDDGEEACDVAR